MFKFNFASSDGCEKETESVLQDKEEDGKTWRNAMKLDLSLSKTDSVPAEYCREFKFHNEIIKILKRDKALDNIRSDNSIDQFAALADVNHSDLEPALYEGGLKVWECSEDLTSYILNELKDKLKGKHVLDLGCGSGVVGILSLKLGAEFVTFQDYNQEVLTHWTSPNVSINSLDKNKCEFWSGDWSSFSELCHHQYDYIFTSETIYNPNNYCKLVQVFTNQLKTDSTVYLAAKTVYFSLGGSVLLFLNQLNQTNQFSYKNVFQSTQGVERVIVEIRKKKLNS